MIAVEIRTAAGHGEGRRAAIGGAQGRQRLDEIGDALEVPELADEDEIAGIAVERHGLELGRRQAVMDHRLAAGRRADLVVEGALRKGALEDDRRR